jgi:hypothetical protein
MEARLVRKELQKCYRGEGVNSYQNCRELAEQYTKMIRDNKVGPTVDGGGKVGGVKGRVGDGRHEGSGRASSCRGGSRLSRDLLLTIILRISSFSSFVT